MTEPLRLHRNLDLRQPSGVKKLLEVIARCPGSVSYQPEDIQKGITTLARLFPSAHWLELSRYMGGSLLIPTGRNRTSVLSLTSAVSLGLQLSRLERCEGFGEFLRGFTNPTQFFDTMFEANVADFCLSQPRCAALQFAPEYHVRGNLRRPDFSLVTVAGLVVCECKSISEEARKYSITFTRIHDTLEKTLKEAGGIANNLRLEVHLQSALAVDVQGWARQVAVKAIQAVDAGLVGQILELGSCKLCVVERASPTVFNRFKLTLLSVTVGNVPVGLTPEYAHLRTTTDRVGAQRAKSAGALIREAKSQLPETQRCVAFIQVIDGPSAKLAAERRLATRDYEHVIACGIWSNDGQQFVHRTTNKDVVSQIFGPFPEEQA